MLPQNWMGAFNRVVYREMYGTVHELQVSPGFELLDYDVYFYHYIIQVFFFIIFWSISYVSFEANVLIELKYLRKYL